jgi:two-component system cell cycle sensor histidine kinase/response regulator CckA
MSTTHQNNTRVAPKTRTHTVLIIDDSPINLSVVMEHLRDKGYEVLVATSGEIGIERAAYVRPDIILLDVMLPGIDGFETCRRLKANPLTQKTPVIFMTVLSETNDKLRGFDAGAVDYVAKPLQPEEVIARISTHLRLYDLSYSLELQNERLAELSGKLGEQARQLRAARDELELRVAERTAELSAANAALSASEEHSRIVLSSISDAILIADPAGRPVYISPNAEQVIGFSSSQLFALSSLSQLFGDDLYSPAELDAQGQIENIERAILDAQGRQHILLITVKRVAISAGVTLYTCREITQRKELEAQLRQAQKMEAIGRLAGGVAHDFNNLLTVIIGHGTLLLDSDGELNNPAYRQDVAQILTASERAAALTRQLLAFSRQQVLELHVLNLNTVVEETVQMLKRLIGEDVTLNTKLEPALGAVYADTHQLQQILLNLAVNARDAMPNGGTLTIETMNAELDPLYARTHPGVSPGPHVMLAVSDTGVGMDAATRERIFEPFFTTKGPGQGTGLGLAMVHGIVSQSGGHIYLYSELGHGTTFKIYLPMVSASAESHAAPVPAPAELAGSETILLVEDEIGVRSLMRDVLESYGYTVLDAPAEQAIALAQSYSGPLHLLITDVVMPTLSGRDLAQALISLRPTTNVLYISGYTDNIIASRDMLPESYSFLQKPFTPEALARKVRTILDRTTAHLPSSAML